MRESERGRRLRALLAVEVRRVVEDLLRRRDLLVHVWSKSRVRAPFLDTTFSRYRSLPMTDLLVLDSDEVRAVEAFYREMDDLRFYLAYTEDMPQSLATVLDGSLARLVPMATRVLTSLGQDGLEDGPPPPWERTGSVFGSRTDEE